MKYKMSKKIRWLLLILSLVAISSFAIVWAVFDFPALDYVLNPESGFGGRPSGEWQLFYFTIKTSIASLNATILAFLFVTYVGVYREIKLKFSLGLSIFSGSMLVSSLISNPIIFGRAGKVIGLPVIFEQIFVLISLITLLYITNKY